MNNRKNTFFINMDAFTQTCCKPIDSLFCLVLDYVIENLSLYIDGSNNKLSSLPFHVKNRVLRRITTSTYFWKKVDLKTILDSLVNEQTDYINLTSAVVDDDVLFILQKCKKLKKLYLSRTKDINITSKGLINLIKNCKNLSYLLLAHSSAMNDSVLGCIAENCPNLMGLDIGESINITDEGVKKLSLLTNLSWITLSGTQITDESITHLVNGPSKLKLKELRIENTFVSDVGLKEIAGNCSNLEILTFYSRKKQDVSCPMFANELKNLKQLTWTVNW